MEGITEEDYLRAKPYIETAQAFAQTTYQSIYIIDYFKKNFLYVSDNPIFLCGHTAEEVKAMGYGFYMSNVPQAELPMLTELNRAGFSAFNATPLEDKMKCLMSYEFLCQTEILGRRSIPIEISFGRNLLTYKMNSQF